MSTPTSITVYKQGAYASAYAGAVGFVILLPLSSLFLDESSETRLIQNVLLLGILVIVPLGFSLVPRDDNDDSLLYRLSLITQPLGAVLVLVSFVLGNTPLSAVCASAWLLVTGLAALAGCLRLRRSELRSPEEVAISASLMFLPIGAVSLLMSRLGIQPLGFGDTIVLLTAVHFHFAGFAAPLLTGLTGRRLRATPRIRKLFTLTVVCVISGTPLVAAGITLSPLVALVGAFVITIGLTTLAILVIGWILSTTPAFRPRILLGVSSIANLPAMILACVYAYSIVFHKLIIDIPQMAMTHGLANAFGFSLCGLTAWALLERAKEQAQSNQI